MTRHFARSTRREPTIALINVVFLMLVFFMAAGTIAPPIDQDVALVRTADLEGAPPPDALVILPGGEFRYRGSAPENIEAFVNALEADERDVVRLVPDRDLDADRLVEIGRALRSAGINRVVIVTERGLE